MPLSLSINRLVTRGIMPARAASNIRSASNVDSMYPLNGGSGTGSDSTPDVELDGIDGSMVGWMLWGEVKRVI
jgi:hypothetical protein